MTRPVPHILMTNPSLSTPCGHGGGTERSAAAGSPPACDLLLRPESRLWRRRLGPLAWAALEDLALATHHSDQGWVAPVGVRDIAARVGITKDTAARAVAALGGAGLVVLGRVQAPDGRWRSGYRLDLPDGIELRTCTTRPDTAPPKPNQPCPDWKDSRCPTTRDAPEYCPNEKDRRSPGGDRQGPPSYSTGQFGTGRSGAHALVARELAGDRAAIPGKRTSPPASGCNPADAIQSQLRRRPRPRSPHRRTP